MDLLKRLFKKLWHDPVWSKVIASLIIATPSAYFLGLFPILADAFRGIINFLSKSTNVYNWILVCLIIISFVAVIIAAKIIHQKAFGVSRVLRFVPLYRQRWWHLAKQQDGSCCSQIVVDIQVTNIVNAPIQIVKVSLIKPKVRIIRAEASLPVEGTSYHSSKHPVQPHGTTTASIHIMTRGKLADQGNPICITLGITDQFGNEYRINNIIIETPDKPIRKTTFLNLLRSLKSGDFSFFRQRGHTDPQAPIMQWTYTPGLKSIDVCEAILKEEKRNYAACGRDRGGLGSLNVGLQSEPNYGVTQVGKVPELLWRKDQGEHISSPNLERLVRTYEALTGPDKDNLEQYLLSHLRKDSPFADVAYFVFLALHRMGRTIDALRTARGFLAGDKFYGYSNLLGTLSALVSHDHFAIEPSLYPQILDVLEGDQEPDFRLREKLNLARLARLDDAP